MCPDNHNRMAAFFLLLFFFWGGGGGGRAGSTSAQMLMQERTPKESLYWKLTLGEKSLAAPGTRTRVSIAPGFSVGRSKSNN